MDSLKGSENIMSELLSDYEREVLGKAEDWCVDSGLIEMLLSLSI